MGNFKGIILAFGLLFFLSNKIDIECQNIKGIKSDEQNEQIELIDKTKLDNQIKGESSKISQNESINEKKPNFAKLMDSPSIGSIKKESVVIEENENKIKNSNENSKDLHINLTGAFIEGENEKSDNTNEVVTAEVNNDKSNEKINEEIIKKSGDDTVSESINKKVSDKDIVDAEDIYIKQQNVDIDDVPSQEEPVQESNLYFLQMLAFISSIFMQLTSIPTVFKILKKKSTGELDGLAYVMLFYSSFLWLVYGMLIENTAVVLPNFSGLTLGLIYTMSYHKYCKNMWLKQKLYSYYKICGFVTFLMYIFIYFMTFEQYVLSAGLLASVSSVINFGAPLSSVREVIKKRDTTSIPIEMTLGSLICSFLWLLYGLTLRDAFLIIPNLGGFLLGLMQVILIAIYSSKEPMQFIVDEACFKEQKDSYRPGGKFYGDGMEDYDNKISDVSTTVHESFFDFTYDETSPLTSDANFVLKQNIEKNENALKSANSAEEDTVLNF